MEIRYISPADDRNDISRIYEESWKYAYRGIIPQHFLDAIPKGRWAGAFDNNDWRTIVCVEDGQPIGTSCFGKSRFGQYPEAGEIISIYFLPEYMGKGYGSQLIKTVLDELIKQGFTEVFLWVLEENVRARRFYEKNGFTCSEEYMDDNIGGKELREVRYTYLTED